MNLLLTISNSYAAYTAVMLQSLVESNPDLVFDAYIVCPDITEEK